MDNKLWIVLLVFIAVVAIGIAMTAPQCENVQGNAVCQKTKTIPGILIGIPGEQVGFSSVVFTEVDITTPHQDPVTPAVNWLSSAVKPKNGVWKIAVSGANAGALFVCVSDAIKDYTDSIVVWLGIAKHPDEPVFIAGTYCLAFYGQVGK